MAKMVEVDVGKFDKFLASIGNTYADPKMRETGIITFQLINSNMNEKYWPVVAIQDTLAKGGFRYYLIENYKDYIKPDVQVNLNKEVISNG